MSKPTIELVHEFHTFYGVKTLTTPGLPSNEVAIRRINLIAEELCELAEALGFGIKVVSPYLTGTGEATISIRPFENTDKVLPNLAEVADALADLDYVVAGTSDECGIPHTEIVAEVHRSNMSKAGLDGKPILREDGKILKGPNYTPPNLWPILLRAEMLAQETAISEETKEAAPE